MDAVTPAVATPEAAPAAAPVSPAEDARAAMRAQTRATREEDSADEVEDSSLPVVESEEEATPEEDGNPDTEPATAETSDESGPDNETDAPEEDVPGKLYAGKYREVEDLEQGYQQTSREASRLAQQVAQQQHVIKRANAELVLKSLAVVPDKPPLLASRPETEQAYYTDLANGDDYAAQQFLNSDWQVEKRKSIEQAQQATRYLDGIAAAQEKASENLAGYVKSTYGSTSLLQEEYEANPEFFHVLDQMPPESLEKFGRRYVDLVAENKRLKAKTTATTDAVRKAVREETREIRTAKQTGQSAASQAKSHPAIKAPPSPQKVSPIDRILQRAEATRKQ